MFQGMVSNIFPCTIVNVYALNEVVNRRILWDELRALKANSNSPWCIGGDFNEILTVNERVECLTVDRGMRDFSDFCNNMEVVDLPMG